MSRLLLALICAASPAAAEPVLSQITADLDGDGAAETFRLTQAQDQRADLIVEAPGRDPVTVPGVVFSGGSGREAELGQAANGSVLLSSMNEAIGRHRWTETLTIAWRDSQYKVVGFTYSWRDTITLEYGICDVNLLTGRVEITDTNDNKTVDQISPAALPLDQWTDAAAPAICREE